MEDSKRLERLVERARAVQRNVRKRRGDFRKAALLGLGAVSRDKVQHRLDGEPCVLEELNPLRVAGGAARGKARVDFRKPRPESVADRRGEVRRQVEDDALLAKRRAGCAARVHLRIGVQIRDLLDRPQE